MADEPISTTTPEVVTVDTRAAPEDVKALKDNFADFWAAEDKKTDAEPEPAPEAPGPEQETKEAPVETKPAQVETKPPKEETQPPVSETTDEEIDSMQLIPNQRPEVYEQFRNVKEKWKADRAKLKAEAERYQQIQAQLSEARANQMTPEVRADYEHAVGIRRRFDFGSDPEFIQRFHAPISNKYNEILDDAAGMLADPAAGKEWAEYMKKNHVPDGLSREWWLNSVIAKVPGELDRNQLMSEVNELVRMQKERNGEIQRRTNDKSSFDNWIQEKATHTAQRVQEELMSEIGVQEKRIQDYLPRDVAQAKTKEERAAIEEHNSRFKKLNEFFQSQVRDISANGPKAWVRVAIEATRSQIMNDQIVNLEKELKDAKAERDQFKTELEKINGVRRKLSHTTGTPPSPPGAKQPANGQGLSLKSLDIRKSFRDFDWGEGT